jgi:hypothetical protein
VRPLVRGPSIHTPYLGAPLIPAEEDPDDEDKFIGRPCYEFNKSLKPALDDTRCGHCRMYLTAQCPHIDDFMDDVEDLAPE